MQDAQTPKKVIAGIPAQVLLLEKGIAQAVGISIGERLHALALKRAKQQTKKTA